MVLKVVPTSSTIWTEAFVASPAAAGQYMSTEYTPGGTVAVE